jgi:predicted aspartyl protease
VEWIPFELAMDSTVVLPIRIADGQATVMLDTGASVSMIDLQLAKRLGLAATGAITLHSDVGAAQAQTAARFSFQLGRNHMSAGPVVLSDLSSLTETVGRQVDCVLGQDAFMNDLLELDFPRRLLGVRSFRQRPNVEEFQEIPLLAGSLGRRHVSLQIEGHQPIQAVFDLGSSNPIMMSRAVAVQDHLLDGRKLSSAATGTVSGIEISTTCTLRQIRFGGVEIGGVPAEIFDNWADPDVPTSLGLPVLQRFRMVIDFSHDRVWLHGDSDGLRAPFQRERSGLGLAFQGDHLDVVHVAKGSPAERQGWANGATIIAVNGKAVGPDYVSSGLFRWRFDPAVTAVVLTTSDGQQHKLTLETYY